MCRCFQTEILSQTITVNCLELLMWMDCAVYYSSKYIVRCFMIHLNNDKQTNLFVPQLSVRVRKCLTHAREHV